MTGGAATRSLLLVAEAVRDYLDRGRNSYQKDLCHKSTKTFQKDISCYCSLFILSRAPSLSILSTVASAGARWRDLFAIGLTREESHSSTCGRHPTVLYPPRLFYVDADGSKIANLADGKSATEEHKHNHAITCQIRRIACTKDFTIVNRCISQTRHHPTRISGLDDFR